MRRNPCALLCGLAAVAALPARGFAATAVPPTSAPPAPDRFALAWVRAPGADRCPSSQELSALLESTVGPVLVPPARATVLVEGLIATAAVGPGYRVLIRATTADGAPVGERRLESAEPECAAITRSALLALAVLIDPDAVAHGLPARVEQAIGQAPAAAAEPSEPPPTTKPAIVPGPDLPGTQPADARAAPPPPGDTGIAVYLAGNVELTPSPMLGIAGAFRTTLHDAWVLELAAAFFPAVDVSISSPYATGTVGFSAAELAPELCRRVRFAGMLELSPCVGGVVGLRFVVPNVKGFPGADPRAYLGPVAALDFAWYPTHLAFVGVRAQGAFLPQDDRFVYTDHDGSTKVLFDPGPVAAYAGVGAGGVW